MLIGLLMAFLFSNGAESEFVSSVPHLQREIRQHVPEKTRRDTLLALVKVYEKEIKKYEKEIKHIRKKLDKISTDRDKSSKDFIELYDEYTQTRIRLISSLIDYRLLFQQQITEQELVLIIEKAILTSKKERRKSDKQEEKAEDKISKVFQKIDEVNNKHIEDTAKLEIITEGFHDFESTIYAYLDEAQELQVEREIMLDDKNATREEIEEIFEKTHQLRYKASIEFAKLRDELIKNTDEREWNDINKELDVFFK